MVAAGPLRFLTILLAALAFLPAGAHLAVLPNKIGLPREAYAVAQGLYQGWALLGLAWVAALLANLALAALLWRRQPRAGRLVGGAALLQAAAFVVFLIWTQPANAATENWTRLPEDWEALRRQWEYSHAANAGLTFLALCLSVLSGLSSAAQDSDRP
jgi:hypothetical protein